MVMSFVIKSYTLFIQLKNMKMLGDEGSLTYERSV